MSRVILPMAVVAVVLLVVPGMVLGIAVLAVAGGTTSSCAGGTQQLGDRVFSAEQTTNAATITGVTAARGLPRRAAVIAVATAIVESGLVNVDHGDRDSLGLFQQRPSQSWGTPAQVLDPVYATNAFLDRLVRIPGWLGLSLGQAAQAVQRSAFPQRYQTREAQAWALVGRFWHGPDHPAGAATACPPEGGSDLPWDPQALPPGYQLPPDPLQRAAVAFALAQVGKPYVYGAKGPEAFDCSGLTQAAWAHAGVAIPAGTRGQVSAGDAVPGLHAVQPGDLLLIPGSLGTRADPRHVGLYAGHGLVVNAYDEDTGVVLDRLENWADHVVALRRPVPPVIPGRWRG